VDGETAPEPNHGFDDSRRLTGANRWFGGPAVTLTPLGRAAGDASAHARWAERVRAMCSVLGWPDPQPVAERHTTGTLLVFAAPEDRLFTATEVNEWAWERASAEAGENAFELAQDLGDTAAGAFRARAAAEQRPALAALRAAARAHGLPLFEDDDEVSVGAGSGSRCWPRDALPAVDAVPWARLHDVPTVLVTGSNGKTTTVRLLAAIAGAAGLTPGLCSTEGVWVGGQQVEAGDYAGPAGARVVLRHPRVQAALLETARGGLLRRGLALRRADIAVVTNISPDHLGEYGIEDADDLAQTKLVVAHAVVPGGTLVLNADDPVLMAVAARLPHAAAARQALFAHEHTHPALNALRSSGGSTCGVLQGELLLSHGGVTQTLGAVASLPLALGGAARHNVANLAAAALAAAVLGLPLAAIQATLQRFGAVPSDNPGRLERWQHRGATVLIDYAHNPDGLAQLLTVARALQPQRLLLLLGQAGNRDDAAITELARTAAAFAPDRVVLKELPLMLRGRTSGEVTALLESGLLAAGLAPQRIERQPDEEAAALLLLDGAGPGDVVVLPIHTAAVRASLAARLVATS
jgi:UDP-N-acetylmuramyl tripeptide synthase